MMTRGEAINRIKDHMKVHHIGEYPHIRLKEALDMALSALRPVSREQVERMRGEWIVKHDKYKEITITECSKCGDETAYEYFFEEADDNFCPACGAPMTDEAVDMVMERWEVFYD